MFDLDMYEQAFTTMLCIGIALLTIVSAPLMIGYGSLIPHSGPIMILLILTKSFLLVGFIGLVAVKLFKFLQSQL